MKNKSQTTTPIANNNLHNEQNYDLISYLNDILGLQFEVLQVNEARGNTLIAINAAFLAGVVLVFQAFSFTEKYIIALLGITMILCSISLFIGLKFTIPRIDARIGNEGNIRGTIGICSLSKEDYYEKVKNLKSDEMVKQLSYQISGMARNNRKGAKYLTISIAFSTISFIPFVAAIICILFF